MSARRTVSPPKPESKTPMVGVIFLKPQVSCGGEYPLENWIIGTIPHRGWGILHHRGCSGKRRLDQAAEARLRLFSGSAELTGSSSRLKCIALNSSTSACIAFSLALEMGKRSANSSRVGGGAVM